MLSHRQGMLCKHHALVDARCDKKKKVFFDARCFAVASSTLSKMLAVQSAHPLSRANPMLLGRAPRRKIKKKTFFFFFFSPLSKHRREAPAKHRAGCNSKAPLSSCSRRILIEATRLHRIDCNARCFRRRCEKKKKRKKTLFFSFFFSQRSRIVGEHREETLRSLIRSRDAMFSRLQRIALEKKLFATRRASLVDALR